MGERAESKEADAEAQAALLRTLADMLPAMLAYWDTDLRCRFATRAYETWFGVTAEAMIGKHASEFLGPHYETYLPNLQAVLRGEAQQFEREVPDPAGGPSRFSLVNYIPDVVDGQVRGFCVLAADITQRKRTEDAHLVLQRRLYAKERLTAMTTLAAGIAHEINNPLASVAGNLELALEQLDADPTATAPLRSTLLEAIEASRRVAGIVQSMRLLARADTERRELIDVREVIEQSLGLVANVVRYRARVVRDLHDVGHVEGNATQLGHVFVGLLMNAAQALPESDTEHNEIRVTAHREDGHVVVEIRDNGCGISEAVQRRIFEPFFTTRDVGGGTGLGLAISYAVVSAFGGVLSVTSKVGEGSAFRVSLPAAPVTVALPALSAREERAPARTGGASPGRQRLLVIDDDKALTHTLKRVLERAFAVTVLNSGREALAALVSSEAPPFDVILCDLMMPEVTGADIYAHVARERPDLVSRFVFMTGGAFTSQGQEFLDACGAPVVAKPFDMKRLRATLEAVALASRA